ncbi:MAG: NUDIX hydrolase [Hyphomicrobiaceae bacterium]
MNAEARRIAFPTMRSEPVPSRPGTDASGADVALELTGAIIAIRDNEPVVLAIRGAGDIADALPSGRFAPGSHVSLDAGLRECVREKTALELGYVEQLCTFGGCRSGACDGNSVSIGYVALMLGGDRAPDATSCTWRSVYDYFPWEDWRHDRPRVLREAIEPRLKAWAATGQAENADASVRDRNERVNISFGFDGARWDDERVLDRYDLLCEAGALTSEPVAPQPGVAAGTFGQTMNGEHRRILAAAIGRLRAKIRYRPVVFELMQAEFTLFDLQKTVEAILGPNLHKQNFRRLVESVGLVEPTGEIRTHTGGRPARLYRFRREVLLERPAPGVRVKAVARG